MHAKDMRACNKLLLPIQHMPETMAIQHANPLGSCKCTKYPKYTAVLAEVVKKLEV